MFEIVLETDDEMAWAAGLAKRFKMPKKSSAKRRQKPMIHYRRPRAGLVQVRLEMELPARLSMAEVDRIARAKAAIFDRLGLAYTLAVHRPDALNDPRNWHIHIVFHPCTGIRTADGGWSFPRGVDGVQKLRPGDIALALGDQEAWSTGGRFWHGGGRDVTALRHAYARICNDVLIAAGHSRRFDPRSYDAMQIAREPAEHLGSIEARLVAAGISTETDQRNAIRYWRAELSDRLEAMHRKFDDLASRIAAEPTASSRTDKGSLDERDLADRRDAILDRVADLRADAKRLVRLDIEERMARSAADRLIGNTDRMLALIAANKASKTDTERAPAIRARRALAERHLAELEFALEPWQADVDAFRRDLLRREREIRADSDCLLSAILAASESRVELVALEAREAVVPTPMAVPVPALTLTGVLDRIRAKKLHVDRIQVGADRGYDVIGLSDEDAAIVNDIHYLARVQKSLEPTASNQEKRIEDLIAKVRERGVDAIASGTRVGTLEPNADANFLARYRNHPLFLRLIDAAEEDWRNHQEKPPRADMPDVASGHVARVGEGAVAVDEAHAAGSTREAAGGVVAASMSEAESRAEIVDVMPTVETEESSITVSLPTSETGRSTSPAAEYLAPRAASRSSGDPLDTAPRPAASEPVSAPGDARPLEINEPAHADEKPLGKPAGPKVAPVPDDVDGATTPASTKGAGDRSETARDPAGQGDDLAQPENETPLVGRVGIAAFDPGLRKDLKAVARRTAEAANMDLVRAELSKRRTPASPPHGSVPETRSSQKDRPDHAADLQGLATPKPAPARASTGRQAKYPDGLARTQAERTIGAAHRNPSVPQASPKHRPPDTEVVRKQQLAVKVREAVETICRKMGDQAADATSSRHHRLIRQIGNLVGEDKLHLRQTNAGVTVASPLVEWLALADEVAEREGGGAVLRQIADAALNVLSPTSARWQSRLIELDATGRVVEQPLSPGQKRRGAGR